MPSVTDVPGWITLKTACKKYGIEYSQILNAVHAGYFTVARFTPKGGTKYVKPDEVEAFARGGLDELERHRKGNKPTRKAPRK